MSKAILKIADLYTTDKSAFEAKYDDYMKIISALTTANSRMNYISKFKNHILAKLKVGKEEKETIKKIETDYPIFKEKSIIKAGKNEYKTFSELKTLKDLETSRVALSLSYPRLKNYSFVPDDIRKFSPTPTDISDKLQQARTNVEQQQLNPIIIEHGQKFLYEICSKGLGHINRPYTYVALGLCLGRRPVELMQGEYKVASTDPKQYLVRVKGLAKKRLRTLKDAEYTIPCLANPELVVHTLQLFKQSYNKVDDIDTLTPTEFNIRYETSLNQLCHKVHTDLKLDFGLDPTTHKPLLLNMHILRRLYALFSFNIYQRKQGSLPVYVKNALAHDDFKNIANYTSVVVNRVEQPYTGDEKVDKQNVDEADRETKIQDVDQMAQKVAEAVEQKLAVNTTMGTMDHGHLNDTLIGLLFGIKDQNDLLIKLMTKLEKTMEETKRTPLTTKPKANPTTKKKS